MLLAQDINLHGEANFLLHSFMDAGDGIWLMKGHCSEDTYIWLIRRIDFCGVFRAHSTKIDLCYEGLGWCIKLLPISTIVLVLEGCS